MTVSGRILANAFQLPTGNVQTLIDNETQRAVAKELEITSKITNIESSTSTSLSKLEAEILSEATTKESEIVSTVSSNFTTLDNKITVKENENDVRI